MFKKIWNFLGSLKAGCYLLLAGATTVFIGSFYAQNHYSFFIKLNEMKIQDWFQENFLTNLSISWWLLLFVLIMFFLGINTFICTFNRLSSLIKNRKKYPLKTFSIRILPSLIHLFFILVMIGHFFTFTGIECQRVPIEKGKKITVKDTSFTVTKIDHFFYPQDSSLHGRIKQTFVELEGANEETLNLSYLNPIKYKDFSFFLDMIKNKKKKKPEKEVCNKAPVYNLKESKKEEKQKNLFEKKERQLQVKILSDPGLGLLVFSFFIILFLMFSYFLSLQTLSKKKSSL